MPNYLPKRIDMTGQRFGRLVVVKFSYTAKYAGKGRAAHWQCVCDCGRKTIVARNNLLNGSVVSCGCKQQEDRIRQGKANRRHGHSNRGSRLYQTWFTMRARCNNPKHTYFENYGGRGIKVCERWEIFENFLADMAPRPNGRTLDRIDPDGDYEPSNCRWATARQQRHNQSKKFTGITKRRRTAGNSNGCLAFGC